MLTCGCGASVSEIASNDATSVPGKAQRYRVECIELERCRERAAEACRSPYSVESEWRNTIPESELPGLNERTRSKDASDWERYTFPRATGIESNAPMPLVSIVVACNG